MKRTFIAVSVLLLVALGYFLLWPVPIDPAVAQLPPAPPLLGDYAVNEVLHATERIGAAAGLAPEDIAIDSAGRIYAGFVDGRILRFQPEAGQVEEFANTGGRPLGLEFDGKHNLIVCDSYKGLLSISPNGSVETLATEHDGKRFGFTDDLDIGADGVIYFSDASWKFGQKEFVEDLLEHRPNGRLLAYDPGTKSTSLLMDNLYFANGVAMGPDDEYVLVVETGAYRVLRYWLRGPQRGKAEVFIANLPGFPDGITRGEDGRLWIALATPRDPMLDATLPRPWLRKVVLRLPKALQPGPKKYGFVLAVDAEGKVVRNYQDPAGAYAPITNVREHAGYLYFGSIEERGFGRLKLPG